MQPLRNAGAKVYRKKVRPAMVRGVDSIEPLHRIAERYRDARREADHFKALYENEHRYAERLERMYEDLRPPFAPRVAKTTQGEVSEGDIREVLAGVHAVNRSFGGFFRIAQQDGDFMRAGVTMAHRLIETNQTGTARSIGHVMQTVHDLRPLGDMCVMLAAMRESLSDTAWTLILRNDIDVIVRYVPAAFFRLAFVRDRELAADALGRVLSGDLFVPDIPDVWFTIAHESFVAGYAELSSQALDRLEEILLDDPGAEGWLRARVNRLREFHVAAVRAAEPLTVEPGQVPFALLDYRVPNRREASRRLADPMRTLATLGQLARHTDVSFAGEPALAEFAGRVQNNIAPDERIPGTQTTVALYSVDRDASSYSAVPDGTWTVVSGRVMAPLSGLEPHSGAHYDLPLNPRLRPIFTSIEIGTLTLAAPGVIEYLRAHGPIGCADWDSVFMLLAADVPAFFSGSLIGTVGTAAPPRPAGGTTSTTTLFFGPKPDTADSGVGRFMREELVDTPLAGNLSACLDTVVRLRDECARVVTGNVQCYLTALAVGTPAELRAKNTRDSEQTTVLASSSAELAARSSRMSDQLAAAFGAILAGAQDAEVYDAWRAACADDVARATEELHSAPGFPQLDFDVDEVADEIRSLAVTVERTIGGQPGTEINVEFSLDSNYKHQLDIVLDSIVSNTERPVRAFVLCRQHTEADFARMAAIFPTVSFVWLPTDNVTYGQIRGMNSWVTPATMDRTLLPVILRDVDRILHFDLDALCLADLGDLFDVEMNGCPIASEAEPQPLYVGGYDTLRRTARRLRAAGTPELSAQFVRRTHSRLPFDFDIFNAGIMVLDLAKMRADDFCKTYLPYVQEYGVNGQVVLNIYVGEKFADAGSDWNRLMRLEQPSEVKIAHWAGPYKPWGHHLYVNGRDLWQAGEDRFAARLAAAALPNSEAAH